MRFTRSGRRSLTMACLATAASLALAACGDDSSSGGGSADSGSGEQPLLVTINKLGTTGYMIDLARGFRAQAAESDVRSREINVELDSERTLTELRSAIASGARGIAITVPDQKLGPAVIRIAEQAGVPLVATNDTIDDADGRAAPFIGFDNARMGELVGADAARRLNEAGWVEDGRSVGVLSVEVQTLSVCQDRTDAATEQMLANVPGLERGDIFHVPYDGSSDAALRAVPGGITAHPDVDHWVVYACSDDGVTGALRALGQADVSTDDIIGVGLGAYLACPEWKSGRETGLKSALYLDGADVGGMAVRALKTAVEEGTPLPANEFAPVEMVDPDTYRAAGLKC
jgi:L-arabinose transport system substrate-binding protein